MSNPSNPTVTRLGSLLRSFSVRACTVVILACCGAICGGENRAQAAGCHSNSQSGSQHFESVASRLPEFFWWTSGNVQRLYEGGQFRYFQVATLPPPCHGPSCRGSVPPMDLGGVPAIESQRTTFTLLLNSRLFQLNERFEHLCTPGAVSPQRPAPSLPLKPPRAVRFFA